MSVCIAHSSRRRYAELSQPNAHISAKDKVPMEEKYEPTLEEMRAMQILTTVPGIGYVHAVVFRFASQVFATER